MNKLALISKYKYTFRLKSYSQSTVNSCLNGLYKVINYVQENEIEKVTPTHISKFLVQTKEKNDYSCATMKQPSHIPVVLSVEEVQRLLNLFINNAWSGCL